MVNGIKGLMKIQENSAHRPSPVETGFDDLGEIATFSFCRVFCSETELHGVKQVFIVGLLAFGTDPQGSC